MISRCFIFFMSNDMKRPKNLRILLLMCSIEWDPIFSSGSMRPCEFFLLDDLLSKARHLHLTGFAFMHSVQDNQIWIKSSALCAPNLVLLIIVLSSAYTNCSNSISPYLDFRSKFDLKTYGLVPNCGI